MIAITSMLILGTLGLPYDIFAQTDAIVLHSTDGTKAIPDWVQFTMQAYLDKQISEREILDAFLFLENNGIMHKSKEAAQQMAEIRAENTALKKKLQTDGIVGPNTATGDAGYKFDIKEHPTDESDDYGRVKVQFHWDEETEQEALHHLRKAYDLNPALQTRVVQFDSNHDKWIDVLSIDWGSTSSKDCSAAEGSSDENSSCWIRVSQTHAGDPDRPIITGNIPNPEQSGDMVLKGSKIHENAPAHDGSAVIVFTGLEFASETVHDLVTKGDTSTTGWDEGIAAFKKGDYGTSSTTTSTSIHELGHALGVFCTVAMDKEVQRHETDLEFLKELSDAVQEDSETTTGATTRLTTGTTMTNIFQELALERAEKLEKKVDSLQVGMDICDAELKNLEDELQTAGDDAQLANIDLQNMLQKHQQTMQMMSNMMKAQHDTLKAIIQNMKA